MPMPSAPDDEDDLPRIAHIGTSVSITGDVAAEEDLYVEGKIDGGIDLPRNHLIVGPNGEVRGAIRARQVTVVGTVDGDITVTERLEVCNTGIVDGDLTAPRLLIQEGATFNGTVTMVAKTVEAKRPASTLKLDATPQVTEHDEDEDEDEDLDDDAVDVKDDVAYGKERDEQAELDTVAMVDEETPTPTPPRTH